MEQLNKVTLRGFVGSVSIYNGAGRTMARLSVGTTHAYKSGDGSPVIDTEWHRVICWEGKNIKDLQMLQKGARVQIDGRIHYGKFTGEDMAEHYYTEIQALKLEVLPEDETFQYEM